MTARGDKGIPAGPFAGDDPRTCLLASTVAAINAHAYEATTPAQIAAAAGVDPPHFHRYFADTDEAALAAYNRVAGWMDELLDLPEPGADLDWSREVPALVGRSLEAITPHPQLARFCAWDFPRSGRRAWARHQATIAHLAVHLRGARSLLPLGDELPSFIEEFVIGGAIWMLGARASRTPEDDLRQLGPEVAYFLLVPYLGIAEAQRASDIGPASPQYRKGGEMYG